MSVGRRLRAARRGKLADSGKLRREGGFVKFIFGVYSVFFIFILATASFSQSKPKVLSGADVPAAAAKKSESAARFKSDGCTFWFDGNYRDCCRQHDLDYWNWHQNGGWQGRLRADNDFFVCVASRGLMAKLAAPVMWTGVRIFGSPLAPTHRRNPINKVSRKIIRMFRRAGGGTQSSRRGGRNTAA